jgi:hypothetical protein
MGKTNPQPPYRLRLRLLAVHNDVNNLSEDDRKMVSALLRHLAGGGATEDFFGVGNPAHRPTSPAVEQRVFDVCLAMTPKEFGGEGLKRAEAIRKVATDHKIDEKKMIEILKMSRAKQLYTYFRGVLKTN